MRKSIISGLNDPAKLESLYRKDKAEFKHIFGSIYAEYRDLPIVQFWHERLNFESSEISWGSGIEWRFIILASVIAGLLAKLPDIFSIDEEFFYMRNAGFLVFPFLSAFFIWQNKLSRKRILLLLIITFISLLYINLLPIDQASDTLILACLHLPLLLWGIFGVSFAGLEIDNDTKRLNFLSFMGELLVMCAMIVLAGIILTGITIGLFELIGLEIVEFYFRYIVVFSAPAVPILACFLVYTNPNLVNKISPVIAKIFSPAVLIMLSIYLAAIIYLGKDPYTDRDFLIVFNVLLIGVMALIFFSIAEGWKENRLGSNKYILLPLSIVTIIINLIALSAIIFRISEWGFTPNRLVVLGANILVLIHLIIVSLKIVKCTTRKASTAEAGKAIVKYLPVYFIWITLVIFLFPLIFGFK